MVHDGQEKTRFKRLTLEFMSAESSCDESGNAIEKGNGREERGETGEERGGEQKER